jgi:hypothetical protein
MRWKDAHEGEEAADSVSEAEHGASRNFVARAAGEEAEDVDEDTWAPAWLPLPL